MNNSPPKQRRGFAAMSPEKQRELASKGGRAAQATGKAHQWTSATAKKAALKYYRGDAEALSLADFRRKSASQIYYLRSGLMTVSCMPEIEHACGGASVDRHPLRVSIAATEDNRTLLDEFAPDSWDIVEEGEANMTVEFASRKDRVEIFDTLVQRSKQLWAY